MVLLIRMSKSSNETTEKERIGKIVSKFVNLEDEKLKKTIKFVDFRWSKIVLMFFQEMK